MLETIVCLIFIAVMGVFNIISRAKTESIVNEFECTTKRNMPSEYHMWLSFNYISLMALSMAFGLLVGITV